MYLYGYVVTLAQLFLLLRLQSTNRSSPQFASTVNHLCPIQSVELGETAALTILYQFYMGKW